MRQKRPLRKPRAEVSQDQIATFLDRPSRTLISLRVDPRVLHVLRAVAADRGVGYQTLIHDVLTSAAIQFEKGTAL
jgi:uncharacterized protein (DUF4415 family)